MRNISIKKTVYINSTITHIEHCLLRNFSEQSQCYFSYFYFWVLSFFEVVINILVRALFKLKYHDNLGSQYWYISKNYIFDISFISFLLVLVRKIKNCNELGDLNVTYLPSILLLSAMLCLLLLPVMIFLRRYNDNIKDEDNTQDIDSVNIS